MAFICNACNRPVVSRKHSRCGYCGAPLAEDQMMSNAEKDKLDQIKAEDEKRHKEWKEQNPDSGSSGSIWDDVDLF